MIQLALDKINEAWETASEEMYKAQAEQQGGAPGGEPLGDASSNGTEKENSDVEDYEFEEVK